MPDAAESNAPTDAAPADLQADAHLENLHRMSTTAGVTNAGYVAVNQTAIVAALLGLASALAFFGWLLLIVPVVGIVFAVVAIRQINDSSGTQTGKGLAYAGLALCILLGGSAIARDAVSVARARGDETRIAETISRLGQAIKAGNYKDAYALHDDAFQNRVTAAQFESTWKSVQVPSSLGKILSMEWNGVPPYIESEGGSPLAATKAKVKFERSQDERFDIILRKVGDRWLIDKFPAFFTDRKPAPKKDVFNLDK
jgi:hypothetical protein